MSIDSQIKEMMVQADKEKLNILLVDDDQNSLKGLARYLETDYDVLTAGNATEAIDIFRKEKPDLVLSDVKMPGMRSAARVERRVEPGPRVPQSPRALPRRPPATHSMRSVVH